MRKDKVRAYKLRREGKSYKEIKAVLGIPLATLAGWFKNEEWSQKIRDELGAKTSLSSPSKLAAIQKANKARWDNKYKEYRTAAEKEFSKKKDSPLFIAGVMLYWGEGSKSPKSSQLKLANSDPMMVRVFYAFLTEELGVTKDKITSYLLLYPDLRDDMQKTFWSRATGIPLSQFRKSAFIKGKNPAKRLSYGICNIAVGSRELKEKMLTWINLYQKELA
ncbi:MAG: hypothetical protein KBC81_02210 [Candidatus Pacebacteria bacterium]|nr:hypothetical protein [Candidatus Paceibacterota bacterium]